MSLPDHSLDPLILESAKKEFISKGFINASLKEICHNAHVTTGALYKRYKGKEQLFSTLIQDTLDDLNQVIADKCQIKPCDMTDDELRQHWVMDEAYMLWWFQFLFERYDGFILLLKAAEGTAYSNFQHDWVNKMTRLTYCYYEEMYKRQLTTTVITEQEFHILLTAFWSTIYEPFIHGYTLAETEEHCHLVCHLFDWKSTIGF